MSPSGKAYIGISRHGLERRWAKHVRNSISRRDKSALCDAIRHYGAEAFKREVLGESDDWKTLVQMEIRAISELRTRVPHGYNLTNGGDGSPGVIPSAASRKRMSESQKQRLSDPIQREQLMRALEKARASASFWWADVTAADRKRHGEAVRRGHARPEAKERVTLANREKAARDGWGEMLSMAQAGCKKGPCTDERREKLREIRRMEWADPVMRAKRLAGFAKARERKAAVK
jgi:hypothetical protein